MTTELTIDDLAISEDVRERLAFEMGHHRLADLSQHSWIELVKTNLTEREVALVERAMAQRGFHFLPSPDGRPHSDYSCVRSGPKFKMDIEPYALDGDMFNISAYISSLSDPFAWMNFREAWLDYLRKASREEVASILPKLISSLRDFSDELNTQFPTAAKDI